MRVDTWRCSRAHSKCMQVRGVRRAGPLLKVFLAGLVWWGDRDEAVKQRMARVWYSIKKGGPAAGVSRTRWRECIRNWGMGWCECACKRTFGIGGDGFFARGKGVCRETDLKEVSRVFPSHNRCSVGTSQRLWFAMPLLFRCEENDGGPAHNAD